MPASATPPGWPTAVKPPAAPGWERSATSWLFDLCPPDYRAYPVLTRRPPVLAWLAAQHVRASVRGARAAMSQVRVDLAELGGRSDPSGGMDAGTVQDVIAMLEVELARLLAAERAVDLVGSALRGERYVPRL